MRSVHIGKSFKEFNSIISKSNITVIKRFEGVRLYLDTFDWRLQKEGMVLYLQKNELTLLFSTNEFPEISKVIRRPKFSTDLDSGRIRMALEDVMGVRALIPVIRQKVATAHYAVLDSNKKTVLRILTEHVLPLEEAPVFLELYPVKGYDGIYREVKAVLPAHGFQQAKQNFFEYLVGKNQIVTERFGSKKSYPLHAEMSVREAVNTIHRQLLNIMCENEEGIIRDIDTEFLHDFRVAVRRTRSLYSQVKDVFDPHIIRQAREDFSNLGKRTNLLRDIDVYLLNQSTYKSLLPDSMHSALEYFFKRLVGERKTECVRFARYLQTKNYHKMIAKWESILAENNAGQSAGAIPILEFASARILKRYQQVIKHGNRINDLTPDNKLHRLRIEGKKLRYTLEFFSALFDSEIMADMIRHLKKLQDNLGEFNDLSVQQRYLYDFAVDMDLSMDKNRHIIITLGVLIGRLYHRQRMVREQFRNNYDYFSETQKTEWIMELSNSKGIIKS